MLLDNLKKRAQTYDVAIAGGGPVGCVTALAFAARGARVLVLEANPQASRRLAGEWIHPPAVAILKKLGVDLAPARPFAGGRGFVVVPDDGSRPVVLPYASNTFAFSFEHAALVERLRAHCDAHPLVDYVPRARVTRVEDHALTYRLDSGSTQTVRPGLVVGATGRTTVANAPVASRATSGTYSRMAGLLLEDIELPFEGFGHVFLGGPGPILAYRIDDRSIRLQMDVPLSLRLRRDRQAVLFEAYAPALPVQVHAAFRRALGGTVVWATNQIKPRTNFGRDGVAHVGDAVGYHHPLTAVGMTLGFQDGVALAEAKSFRAYRRERSLKSRVPELLAVALYEVFADTSDETVEMRKAIYELWRHDPTERFRTMRFLGCQETSPLAFGSSFLKSMLLAGKSLTSRALKTGDWDHTAEVTSELAMRVRWLIGGALHLTAANPTSTAPSSASRPSETESAEAEFTRALRASSVKADIVEHPSVDDHLMRASKSHVSSAVALDRGVRALVALQDKDGCWEGEVVWCPMLAAQYVIASHLMKRAIEPGRRARFLLHFERTMLPSGTWGLHDASPPYLFVTVLVYVAARMLGVPADAPLLSRARAFIEAEGGALAIPTWGKFWLALAGLYRWDGVNPVLPELWLQPRSSPLHPSRYYCHTRHIYMSMSVLYAERFVGEETDLTRALRAELYPAAIFPGGYDAIDFAGARGMLREGDLYEAPSRTLKAAYQALRIGEHAVPKATRAAVLVELRDRIRYELHTTAHTSISPVSGILNVLALFVKDEADADAAKAYTTLDGWIWEDDTDGARIAGARSQSWDTGFAVQALTQAAAHVDVKRALRLADRFLEENQIRASFPRYAEYERIDPEGGYCFAARWHGWPVSDCTAEALLGRLESPEGRPDRDAIEAAVRFILRTQNDDGGFSTYEPRRTGVSLESMNPAEMFGDSMTEFSFTECTASCIAALVAARAHLADPSAADAAVARGRAYLRTVQHPNGSWPGAWGIRLIYGTLFGIRGLVASGVPTTDPAIRKAAEWLKMRQRPDGSWGEHFAATTKDGYVEADEGQVTQTAWALSALLEANDYNWDAIERAAGFLAGKQLASGEWPTQAPMGVFFHTALLDYTLYKSYFPVWALAQFETRRKQRAELFTLDTGPRAAQTQRPSVSALPSIDQPS